MTAFTFPTHGGGLAAACSLRMRRLLLLLAVAGAALPASASAAPNVVVIETDDQTVADMAAMPRTRELIGAAGVRFERSFVSLATCCPSRATFLTGRYAHNHGVQAIRPPFGGFYRLDGAETLPVWLQRAGYATGVVGKYLNGYGSRDRYEVPPGWTEFHGLLGRSTYLGSTPGASPARRSFVTSAHCRPAGATKRTLRGLIVTSGGGGAGRRRPRGRPAAPATHLPYPAAVDAASRHPGRRSAAAPR